MFDNDLLLSFLFMTILFLRQISILKQPNKLNYAPLMIGIGMVSSIVHFIIHPEALNLMLLMRESLLPLLVSVLLFIVMNIMHQTQEKESERIHDNFSQTMVSQITELKEFMSELEDRMMAFQHEDRSVQEDIRVKFKEDIKSLDAIKTNQLKFLEKFDDMSRWHSDVSRGFADFTNIQLPELDNVMHKHIDILRVAEQDHYNQVKNILDKATQSRFEISEDMDQLKTSINSIKNISNNITDEVVKNTLEQLSGVVKSFENEMLTLKSHTESVKTTLYEGESTLSTIRQESEMIMKQMILSSNKMSELQKQNNELHDIYGIIKDLMSDIEAIKADYVKSQSQLSLISGELKLAGDNQIETMRGQIESLSEVLSNRIDESLAKLHEHYHIADDNITQSVQVLAKKAQLQKGYVQEGYKGLDS